MESSADINLAPDGDSDCEAFKPDPRIQKELDKLNTSSTDINRLENELDEARSKYRNIVSTLSGQMETFARGKKKNIQKAREYYKISGEAKLAQGEALKAARQYQTAVGVYKAAKETVALAEKRLTESTTAAAAPLTSAWQEMLNHAISKVSEAEKEKAKSELDHKRRSSRFAELEAKLQMLEKKFSKSIKKAKPYFDLKSELDIKLMQQKQNVTDLHAAIKCTKLKYNESLRRLEAISEEIHESRKAKYWANVPRLPGVGADNDSLVSDMSEIDLKSVISSEIDDGSSSDSYPDDTDNSITCTEETAESVEDDIRARENTITNANESFGDEVKLKIELCCKNGCIACATIGKNDEINMKNKELPLTDNNDIKNHTQDASTIKSNTSEDVQCDTECDKAESNNRQTGVEVEYTNCNMDKIERPSLSGSED